MVKVQHLRGSQRVHMLSWTVCMFLLWSPRMGGDRGGGLGKVNLTVYSLGLFSSSVASLLSSSWPPFFLPFCCFLVRASFVCFS